MSRSYNGFARPPLADDEGDGRRDGDERQADDQRAHRSAPAAKLIARMSDADEDGRQDAAEVVHRLVGFVDMGGNEPPGHEQRDGRERQRHEEDRTPLEPLEQEPGDERAERGDRSAERGPEGDRPSPRRARDHSAVISASVVG